MTKPNTKPDTQTIIHGMNMAIANAHRLYGDALCLFNASRYVSAASLLTIVDDEIEKALIIRAMHYAQSPKTIKELWDECRNPSNRERLFLNNPEIVAAIKKGQTRYLYTDYVDGEWKYPAIAIEEWEVRTRLEEVQAELLDCNAWVGQFSKEVLDSEQV